MWMYCSTVSMDQVEMTTWYCEIHGITWDPDLENNDACPSCSESWYEVDENGEML